MNGFDRLELSTETLRELTHAELTAVAGGNGQSAQGCVGEKIRDLISQLNCYSWHTEQCHQLTGGCS